MATYHTVRQGECLHSIAKKYGFADYRVIYDHPNNAEFKLKRPDPSILNPGDVIFIPDKQQKQVSRGTEQQHRFQVRTPKVKFRLRLLLNNQPRAGLVYELCIDKRETLRGRTDADGWIEQDIPVDAQQGKLIVQDGDQREEYRLLFGYLDPIDTICGVQARLQNLGYYAGPIDGRVNPATTAALKRFQKEHGLSVTGTVDSQTRSALQTAHGS